MTTYVKANFQYFKSKKALKEYVKKNPNGEIIIEYHGPLGRDVFNIRDDPNKTYYFSGPNPYTPHKYYGQIKFNGDRVIIS